MYIFREDSMKYFLSALVFASFFLSGCQEFFEDRIAKAELEENRAKWDAQSISVYQMKYTREDANQTLQYIFNIEDNKIVKAGRTFGSEAEYSYFEEENYLGETIEELFSLIVFEIAKENTDINVLYDVQKGYPKEITVNAKSMNYYTINTVLNEEYEDILDFGVIECPTVMVPAFSIDVRDRYTNEKICATATVVDEHNNTTILNNSPMCEDSNDVTLLGYDFFKNGLFTITVESTFYEPVVFRDVNASFSSCGGEISQKLEAKMLRSGGISPKEYMEQKAKLDAAKKLFELSDLGVHSFNITKSNSYNKFTFTTYRVAVDAEGNITSVSNDVNQTNPPLTYFKTLGEWFSKLERWLNEGVAIGTTYHSKYGFPTFMGPNHPFIDFIDPWSIELIDNVACVTVEKGPSIIRILDDKSNENVSCDYNITLQDGNSSIKLDCNEDVFEKRLEIGNYSVDIVPAILPEYGPTDNPAFFRFTPTTFDVRQDRCGVIPIDLSILRE